MAARKSKPLDYGRALRLLSARDNCSQLEIAEAIGVQASYVSLLFNGQRRNPSTDVLQGLAKYFQCSVADVLSLAEGRGGVVFS
jgi:transcriptional regulator with XRE-family HTH domain